MCVFVGGGSLECRLRMIRHNPASVFSDAFDAPFEFLSVLQLVLSVMWRL